MKDKHLLELLDTIKLADASTDEYMMIIVAAIRGYCEEKIHRDSLALADPEGTRIVCPNCDQYTMVHHFQWEAIICNKCQSMVAKRDWSLYQEIYPGENAVDLDEIRLDQEIDAGEKKH